MAKALKVGAETLCTNPIVNEMVPTEIYTRVERAA